MLLLVGNIDMFYASAVHQVRLQAIETYRGTVFNLSVRSSVRSTKREHDILKRNEPILMPIGTSGPRGRRMR